MKQFTSLAAFSLHLVESAAQEVLALNAGLEAVAVHVEKQAKEEIGHYQQAVGPFPAWQQLADSTKADRLAQGYSENDPGLRSGDMRDSIGHQVHGPEALIGSNDDHLVYFELGTDKQPPRPVLGPAVEYSHEFIRKTLGGAAVAGILGTTTIPARLEYDHDV